METEKYIATIMQRHYIGENAFIYNSIHPAVGTIDPKTGIFTDETGNEYASMTDKSLMYSEIPFAYYNHIGLKNVKEAILADLPLEESIKRYDELCKDIFYYVCNNNGEIYSMVFNKQQLQDMAMKLLHGTNDKTDVGVENNKNGELAEEEIDGDLVELISDIVAGKYSLEELKDLRKQMVCHTENLESVMDTIDLQIEATEKGEATVKLEDYTEDCPEEETSLAAIKHNLPIDINELYDEVTKTLIAQDVPARRLIVELARMSMNKANKNGILLTGSTGVGKTKLMSLVAKYVNRPFLTVDSTQLTVPGIIGLSVEQCLWSLYVSCDRDLEKTQKAIVFFDEIDKKGSSKKSDVSGKGVLNVLLKFLDGTVYTACENPQAVTGSNSVNIDTSNMLVVVGGAFTDVYKEMNKKHPLGFTSEDYGTVDSNEPTIEDFVEKAMMPDEFMGRVPIIIHLNDLTPEAMRRILLESDESPLKREECCFGALGTKLSVTEEYLNNITKKAYDRKIGARGLAGLVTDTTWKPFDRVCSNIGEYQEVILDGDTVEDNENYQLVLTKKKETR